MALDIGQGIMENVLTLIREGRVAEAEAHAESIGVPTEFDKESGDAIFRSRGHRKRYCRACGFHDKDGGYGDP